VKVRHVPQHTGRYRIRINLKHDISISGEAPYIRRRETELPRVNLDIDNINSENVTKGHFKVSTRRQHHFVFSRLRGQEEELTIWGDVIPKYRLSSSGLSSRMMTPVVASTARMTITTLSRNGAVQFSRPAAARGLALRYFGSDAKSDTFLPVSEVTERVLNVVKNFEKIDPAKVRSVSLLLSSFEQSTNLNLR
jgi:hypothetical protein